MTSPSAASLAAISSRPPSCEGGGRLAAPLGLGRQHAEDVVVGELAGLLAGDLGVGDGGQHHPQGRGAQLVTRLDGGGEVGAETVLQSTHATHCGSLGRMPFLPVRRGARWPSAPSPAAGLTTYAAWEARQYTLRRVTVPLLPAGPRAAEGAAPQRHPHGARPAGQAGVAARAGRPRARPGRQHRRQPRPRRARCRSSPTRSAACSTCPASTSSAPTTTGCRACATRSSTCCPTPASGTRRAASCRGPTSRSASTRPAGST